MVIGIDIDDTITDTSVYFTPFVAEYFGLSKQYLIDNNIYYVFLPEEMRDKAFEFEYKTFKTEIFRIPLKANAAEIINKLKSDGHTIVIVTARDKKTFDDPLKTTKRQLETHKIEYDKIVCARDKKSVARRENLDVFIDDSFRNLDSVKKIVPHIFLFTSPYNKDKNSQYERCDSWLEVYDKICKLNKKL